MVNNKFYKITLVSINFRDVSDLTGIIFVFIEYFRTKCVQHFFLRMPTCFYKKNSMQF